MAQFGRPDSTVTQTAFTNGFAEIDEATASDADFAYSTAGSVGQLEVGLSDVSDPQASTGHIIRYRVAKVTSAGALSGTGNTPTITVALYQGTTLIGSDAARTPTGSWVGFTWTLTGTQADAITDYSDLRIRVDVTNSGGNTSNRRGGAISWAELEVPTPAPVTHDGAASLTGTATVAASATVSPGPPTDPFGAKVYENIANVAAWYRMGEASGPVVDFKGGPDGTASGGVTRDVAGLSGTGADGAIAFDRGTSGFVAVPDHAGIDQGDGPLSWVCLFARDDLGASDSTLISKGANAPILQVSGSPNGQVLFYVRSSSLAVHSSVNLTDGNRHLIVGTKDASDVWKLYIDGIDVSVVDASPSTVSTALDLNIGRDVQTSDTFADGTIDEVVLFNEALSAAFVEELAVAAGLITANFVDGAASLTGAATLGATGEAVRQGSATPTGTGAVAAAATLSQAASAALTGAASTSATGTRVVQATSSPSGLASLVATGGIRMTGAAALAGAATLAVAGSTVRPGAASLSGTAAVGAGATIRHGATSSLSGSAVLGAAAVMRLSGAASLAGSGTVAVSGGATAIHDGEASVAATGSLAASGTAVRQGSSAAAGAASVTAAGSLRTAAAAALAAAGSLSASGAILGESASATLSGTGTLAASPERVIGGTISLDALAVAMLAGSLRHGGQVAVTGTAATSIDGTAVRLGLAAIVAGATIDATGGLVLEGVGLLAGMGAIAAVGLVIPPFVPLHPNAQGRVSVGRDRRDGVALGRTGGRVTVGRRRALVVIVGEEGTVRIT